MESELVINIGLCIIAAWVLGVAFQAIRQPLILAYLVAGFAIGPFGFRWITEAHSIETISSIGLILLLFMIGLEIDLKKMLSAGRLITLLGSIQILGCVAIGWAFFHALGLVGTQYEAIYLGVAVALSSTVIIVKILYEKHELETLAGRLTLGVLVLQDLAAILFLAIQPNLKNPALGFVTLALAKVIVLVAVGFLVSRFILPPIFRSVARLPELVLVGALAWCFALAGLAHVLGLSREMGALIAGVAISTFPYTLDVASKVTSIRDFFVTLFFVGLGMSIPWPSLNVLTGMFIVACLLIGSRFLTVFLPLYTMKQGHRMSLIPAVNLCQMSELSLVLLALGKASGDVSEKTMTIAAFAFAFLAVLSTYGISNNDTILRWTVPWLNRLGLPDLPGSSGNRASGAHSKRIFLLGFSWTASSLLAEITRDEPGLLNELVVIDFNPHVNEQLRQRGVDVIYGDISQRDTLLHAGLGHAEVIVCSLPNSLLKGATNLKLLRQVRSLNPTAQVIVHAERLADVPALYAAGADYVVAPRLLEADHLLDLVGAARDRRLGQHRDQQLQTISGRDEVVP